MNIVEPSQNEKDREIEDILSKGLSKHKSLWWYLREIYRALGLRYIFLNTWQSVFMTVAAIFGFFLLYPLSAGQYIYTALFAVAPIFFILIVLLSETLERVGGLYELKMTCKYTVQQIVAFRVLCFSLMGAVFCAFMSIYFSRLPVVHDPFRAFSISLCALFLCSLLTLFILRRFNWKWIHFAAVLLWMAVGFLPAWIFGERWESFLSRIPVALTVFVAVIACALFLKEIKKLMNIHNREVEYYAGC